MKKRIFWPCITLIFHAYSLGAQCDPAVILLGDSVCLNEDLAITNNTMGFSNYEWDFCPQSLSNALSTTNLVSISGASQTFGLDVVSEGANIYVFVISRGNNSLIRLRFQGDFSDTPDIQNLGNINGLFNSPQGISITKQNESWFILVSNSSGSVIRVDLGSSIENNSPSASISHTFSSFASLRGNSVIRSDNNYYLFVLGGGTSGRVRILDYGNSLTNIPNLIPGEIVVGNDPNAISLINQCDSWKAIVSSNLSNKIFKLDFNSGLTSLPTIDEVTGIVRPRGVSMEKDAAGLYAFVAAESGNLFRLDLGEEFIESSIINLGAMEVTPWAIGYKVFKLGSIFYSLAGGFSDGKLSIKSFVEDCNVSIDYSSDLEPLGVNYSTSGYKKVQLKYFNENTEANYFLDSIYVRRSPIANFTVEGRCSSNSTEFTDLSSADNLNIVNWTWNFDDPISGGNNTSSTQNPTHSYSIPGTYSVSLEVVDECGVSSSVITSVEIVDIDDLQVAFSSDPLKCSNAEIHFFDESTYLFDIPKSWVWDFGGQGTSTEENPVFTFSNPGAYDVALTVTGESGCSKILVKNIIVIEGTLPVFSFDDSCVGEEVLFTNSTVGDVADVNWEFSNGYTSTLTNPTLAFDNEGTYDITLNITNAEGCETFDTQTITIHALPVVDFSNELACETLTTQFEDLSTVNIDNLSSWRWDFGDGSDFSIDQNAGHVFNSAGDFEVELAATSSFGCVDSLTKVVTVLKAPDATFEFDKICLDVPIQFTDTSSPVVGEAIIGWSWNLGGKFTSEQNPQNTFENTLDYSISLTVTSENLCTATETKIIYIPPVPTLEFTLENDCENETAQLLDVTEISGDNIASRTWSVNGSQVSSDLSFDYDFNEAGNYDLSLSIVTENGCDYESSRAITIHPKPSANFVTSFDFGAPPFVVDFTNQSAGAQSYSWEFEEGATSSEVNPTHTFESLGEFDISLVAISDQNCTDTTFSRIQVLEPLLDAEVINFNVLPTATGDKLSFAIRNNGTIRLDSLSVTVDLGGELEVYETINKPMNPNEVISAQLSLTLDNKRLEYICIDVKPFIQAYQDVNEDNNRGCLTFSQERFIVSNLYPNPSSSNVTFDVIATQDALASIELLSAAGDLIDTFYAQVYEGNNKLNFDFERLKGGIYLLKVELEGQSKVLRLMISD